MMYIDNSKKKKLVGESAMANPAVQQDRLQQKRDKVWHLIPLLTKYKQGAYSDAIASSFAFCFRAFSYSLAP